MDNWYVFVAQPHREQIAVKHLQNQSFEVFLPTTLKPVRHARKTRIKAAPLFPGYGFVSFDKKLDFWRSINATRGVKYLITGNEIPTPVPTQFISMLRSLADEDGVVSFENVLKPGDRVRIATGPFVNHIGKLAKLDRKGRVEVLLALLCGEVQVKMLASNLVPA